MGTEILAIRGAGGLGEERVLALAGALGIGAYEARRHLAQPGPRVVATFGDGDRAAAAAAALRAAGFEPILLDPDDAPERLVIRSFTLEARGFAAVDRQGTGIHVPWTCIEALIRGVRAGAETPEREPFVEIHAADAPVLALYERQLHYDGLHLEREPTAAANLLRLLARLRDAAPHAAYDERLLTRTGQLSVLGDVLVPEAHLELATLLLVRTLRPLRPAA